MRETVEDDRMRRNLWTAPIAFSILAAALLPRSLEGAERGAWTIDPARTHIAFAIDAIGYPRTNGQFHGFQGRIAVDFEHWDKSSVAFRVETKSVDVGSQSFSDYVRSLAFLDSDRFPTIDFVSKSVERIDDRTIRVSGDLTMLGVTKPLAVDVAVRRETQTGGSRLAFLARTRIDRLEFGMNSGYPLVSRDIELEISSEASGL
jgi:polyisoprenoid-binding protein YceI